MNITTSTNLNSVLIALGSNLPGLNGRTPAENIYEGVHQLKRNGFCSLRLSSLYQTTPVPPSAQPHFVNAVALAFTTLSPAGVMEVLHDIERSLGRTRSVKNEARILDLDLLDFNGLVVDCPDEENGGLTLPHPRLHERVFVLQPLCDVAADWHHPKLGESAAMLLLALPSERGIRL